jgi:hypothetical protein
MPRIELGFAVATLIAILLAVAAYGAAWLTYRYTLPPVSPLRRRILIALRGTALALTLLLLAEPLLRFIITSIQPPALAVLIDNSRSMRIRDRQGDRAARLREVLGSQVFRGAPNNARILSGTFGLKPRELTDALPESLALNEEATDIAGALRALDGAKEEENIRAAVLVTDGAYTLGQNPLHEAGELGLPLFTVGIGDSAEQKDVLITKVVTNDLVYGDTEVPVDVTVKSSGYAGKRVEAVLQQEGRELSRTAITVEEGTREYPVRLTYTPQGEGMQKFTVRLSGLDGELTTENNRKSFFARVLKNRLRIVIIAGGPSTDLSVVRQTLSEQPHLRVRAFTQKQGGGFYEGELYQSALDSADCIVTIAFPTQATEERPLAMIRGAVTTGLKPLLYIDGKSVDEARLRTLSPPLPFTTAGLAPGEMYAFFVPSTGQINHPILAAGTPGQAAWDRLPPVFRRQGTYRARPEAQLLGTMGTQNITTQEPFILTRSVNREKSLAVLAYGIWRWRLMAQGSPGTEGILSGFLGAAVRWLTTRDDDRPVKTLTTRDQYTQGEPVEFLGQVYDVTSAPVDNAQMTVTVEQQGREFTTQLRGIGNGRYEGVMEGLAPGEYSYRSAAALDGQPLGEDRGKFSVGELDLEYIDTRMNAPLLRQLAARTGGAAFTPAELGGLSAVLASLPSFTSREVRHVTTLELWNWRWLLGAIVVLFGTEWFVRKRSGML